VLLALRFLNTNPDSNLTQRSLIAGLGISSRKELPESVQSGFMDQVLKALPFLRNKLGGHGHGAAVVDIPPGYGDLAIQIAAAFQNFLGCASFSLFTTRYAGPARNFSSASFAQVSNAY
jgi:hypothetical protein